MGRIPRVHFPGAIYHVMAKGVDDRDVYLCDADRRDFLEKMGRIAEAGGAKVIAYCLMGHHFHILIRVASVPLSVIMQRLVGGYAKVFNRRHDRTGHLFQARYTANLILDDVYFANVVPYIHMNPVRSGFVSSPEDWPWSSYKPGDTVFIAADFDPWPVGETETAVLRLHAEARRPTIEAIAREVAAAAGVDESTLRSSSRHRPIIRAKREFVSTASRVGYSFRQISKWLGAPFNSVCRYGRANTATVRSLTP
jgi:REP element-mobilizing transposase RayT